MTGKAGISINRRELLKQSAAAGLAAGLGSICGRKATAQASTSGPAADTISRLPVPSGGKLPAAFVLGKDAEVLDFCGPLEVFAGAATKDGTPLFAPYTVAATSAPVIVRGNMKVVPDYDFKSAPQPKVIVIPAMDDDSAPEEMYEWIRLASKDADVTMSVCTGAFVLAKTGLLNGKSATTHHSGYFMLAANYPQVHLVRGARFVEQGDLATAGGVSSGIDLAIRVVERYVGREATDELIDMLEYQGKGWQNSGSNRAFATMPELTGLKPLCPVCFMGADRSISARYRGKTYDFCMESHKALFEQHKDIFGRFLAEDAAAGSRFNI
ncbi:MAG TPA: DJ-1/PfpI family protein [Acidobacteriaceae bacterium]|nr:DJ-1/PfpI family protein [Acidobacteriaceae bacterium]